MEQKCFHCCIMTNKLHRMILVVLAIALSSNAADKKPDPNQLVRAANENSDLSKIPPHRLTGTVVLKPGGQNESIGSITVYRDRDRFRSDIELSSQHRTWLHIGNKVYVSGSSPIVFMGLQGLNDLENTWREPQLADGGIKYGSPSRKKARGKDEWCFNAHQRDYDPRHLCFDDVQKLLTTGGYQEYFYQFSDFQTVEGRHYPGDIQRIKQGKVVLEIRNLRAQLDSVPESVFNIPPGAMEFETCEDLISPKLTSEPQLFPRGTPFQSDESLKIFIYGIVGEDGTLGHVQ